MSILLLIAFAFASGLILGMTVARIQEGNVYAKELRRVRLRDTLERVSWRTSQVIQSAAADGPPGSWWVADPPRLW